MTPRTIVVGAARVSIINVGDVTLPLAPAMGLTEAELSTAGAEDLVGQRVIPLQSVLIEHDGAVVLVDSGLYDIEPGSEYAVDGYRPPPSQLAQLEAMGVDPAAIQHVVVTHRHWDHFNGLAAGGVPVFPNARHHLGAGDWPAVQAALGTSDSREARALGVVHARGLLQLTEAETDLGHGISIVPAPGETSGHQVVRLHSAGETLYALGDIYHHPIEVARPDWMVRWADRASNAASRRQLLARAVPERALVVLSHAAAIGRLGGTVESPLWTAS